MPTTDQYGVYTRNGDRRTAGSPAEAVRYTFDGWTRIADEPDPPPDPKPAATTRAKTTSSR